MNHESPSTSIGSLLAIETSSEQGSVCLFFCHGNTEAISEASPPGSKCSDWLLPAIDRVLQRAALTLPQVDAIAFGAGPGAFTGVRTACATAQALAYAHEKPLYAVDGLHALALLAQTLAPEATQLDVLLDARMGELYAARFTTDDDTRVRPLIATRLISIAEAKSTFGGATGPAQARFATGSGAKLIDNDVMNQRIIDDTSLTPIWAQGVAMLCLQLGEAALVDPLLAEPLYVRNNVAQTEVERAASKLNSAVAVTC
ncbi:MAG: tRNA (adenosine(37)-N6)-threonylcarbamoyltransferase complex dimerization subunit type 1 TsaB [Betaproteobacteria bacterium]|nr:MAG: tRNA (adenosine(37)-N6)-threonylcarbamoyltransferase complex dimerization subunit type 1 TsaB [Betaproteobacteria bacterium]